MQESLSFHCAITGQPMAAVQEEDRLAAAEAGMAATVESGTAAASSADQKASIRSALTPPLSPEDVTITVRCFAAHPLLLSEFCSSSSSSAAAPFLCC